MNKIVYGYGIGQRPQIDFGQAFAFEAPLDIKVVDVGFINGELAVRGLATPNTIKAWFPILVVKFGQPLKPTLGAVVGDHIGKFLGERGEIFDVFQLLPWPKPAQVILNA